MSNSGQKNERLNDLDAVRAFALLLGIVFHSSLSFIPIFIGWAVMDISTSELVSLFAMIGHSFRMELFFLVAGFFSHRSFHRKGTKTFLWSRCLRIAIPFVVSWWFLRPLLVSGWIMGAESMRGEVQIFKALLAGFASLSNLPQDLFTGTHLWFLYYLMLITFVQLALHLVLNLPHLYPHLKQLKLTNKARQVMYWLCHTRMAFILLCIPTSICLWFMEQWGVDTPDKTLLPHIPVFLLYGGFFTFGWLLAKENTLLEKFAEFRWEKLILALIAIATTAFLYRYSQQLGHPSFVLLKFAFCLSYAIMTWCLVMLSLGFFKRYFTRPRKSISYLADASYSLYLVHLPIVIYLQIFFSEFAFHWSFKLGIISTLSIFISLIIYDLVIRGTLIGATLNGKRKSSLLLVKINVLSKKDINTTN